MYKVQQMTENIQTADFVVFNVGEDSKTAFPKFI